MMKTLYQKYLELFEIPDFLNKYLKVPSLVRLKKIGYFCGMDYASKNIYEFKGYISRFDHSLTVALITWRFTHDKNATIAGLIHDVSTPCFSHVIDYMNKDYEEMESTEEYAENILRNDSCFLECLKKDNISIENVVDFKNYSIVDNNRPKLCADRLDGVILTGLYWTKSISFEDVSNMLAATVVFENEEGEKELGFNDKSIAEQVAKTSNLIDEYCHSNEDNFMMELLASITKRAIEINLITYDELFVSDEKTILNKFEKSTDEYLKNDLNTFYMAKKEDVPNMKMPKVKIRDLNPLVNGKRIKKASNG